MGFEVVVRPVILPNIRPTKALVLAPSASGDPNQGMAELGGGSAKFVGTSYSFSMSYSSSHPQRESKRQFDTERVYQKDDKGKINRDNFIEVERLKKLRLEGDQTTKVIYADPPKEDNVEVVNPDQTRSSGG